MKATLYRNIVILVYVLLLPLVGFAQRAGDLDTSFNVGAGVIGDVMNTYLYSTALQSDGKIIIGGSFTHYNGAERFGLARLNSDGTNDTTFYSEANGSINTIIV